jgi:transcription antitermination factor NusG
MIPLEEFNKGDSVRVTNGRYDGEIGIVESVSSEQMRATDFNLVWVRLSPIHVDGFRPERLQKLDNTGAREA